jgi:hypothetical protein
MLPSRRIFRAVDLLRDEGMFSKGPWALIFNDIKMVLDMLNDPETEKKDQKRDHGDNDADDDLFGQYDDITIGHSVLF